MNEPRKQVLGEYRVEHLRPLPEKMEEFLPLWNARNAAIEAGNKAEEDRLTAQMRPLQYEARRLLLF